MITDFPEAKKIIQKAINGVMRQQVKKNAPVLAMSNKKTLHEGDKMGVLYSDGKHVTNSLKLIHSEFTVAHKDIPTMKPDDFMSKVSGVAEDIAGQMERGVFKEINEAVIENGNIILGNPSLSPDSILLALEKVQIDFTDDDRSKPVMPSLFAGREAVDNLIKLDAEMTSEAKEAHQKREREILDKKFDEYINDLNSRRIID